MHYRISFIFVTFISLGFLLCIAGRKAQDANIPDESKNPLSCIPGHRKNMK